MIHPACVTVEDNDKLVPPPSAKRKGNARLRRAPSIRDKGAVLQLDPKCFELLQQHHTTIGQPAWLEIEELTQFSSACQTFFIDVSVLPDDALRPVVSMAWLASS